MKPPRRPPAPPPAARRNDVIGSPSESPMQGSEGISI